MSLAKSDTLIDEFPEEPAAVQRLLELLRDAASRVGRREYRADRLYDLLQPSSYRVLIQILSSAVDKGMLNRIFRVLSSTGGGIGDFSAVMEIPLIIYDSRIGHDVEVSTDDIELIFVIQQ